MLRRDRKRRVLKGGRRKGVALLRRKQSVTVFNRGRVASSFHLNGDEKHLVGAQNSVAIAKLVASEQLSGSDAAHVLTGDIDLKEPQGRNRSPIGRLDSCTGRYIRRRPGQMGMVGEVRKLLHGKTALVNRRRAEMTFWRIVDVRQELHSIGWNAGVAGKKVPLVDDAISQGVELAHDVPAVCLRHIGRETRLNFRERRLRLLPEKQVGKLNPMPRADQV